MLGPRFFDDAETLKQRDPVAYAHEYMGEVVGCGTAVFENLELRPITGEEIAGSTGATTASTSAGILTRTTSAG